MFAHIAYVLFHLITQPSKFQFGRTNLLYISNEVANDTLPHIGKFLRYKILRMLLFKLFMNKFSKMFYCIRCLLALQSF